MCNQPLVSVIIPTFNRCRLVLEAIESVRTQTYAALELIVADDGSSDETQDRLRGLPLIYLKLPHSGFPGRVRNLAAQRAGGEYLAFLDSDDLWKPEKIAKQVRYLREHPGLQLCHTREIWLRDGKTISQAGQKHARSGNVFRDAVKKCTIGPSTVLLTKNLFMQCGMFDPNLEIAEDYELWLRVCATHPVGYLDEPLIVKRAGHDGQLSEKYGQIEIFRLTALKSDIDRRCFTGEALAIARAELVRKCRIYAKGCLKRDRGEQAARYFAWADRYDRQESGLCSQE